MRALCSCFIKLIKLYGLSYVYIETLIFKVVLSQVRVVMFEEKVEILRTTFEN